MTLNATLDSYPCPKPAGDITVLRVGSETSCAKDASRPTCNGPLPGPGPYRVKFLALEGSVPVAETGWSMPITLRTAKSPHSIPTASSGHSAGMIAITIILSILLAILLAALVAMLVFCGRHAKGSITLAPPAGHSALPGCPCATRDGVSILPPPLPEPPPWSPAKGNRANPAINSCREQRGSSGAMVSSGNRGSSPPCTP
ncbi:uroplakin-3b-like protein 1 [Geospiza fortis]|uniref:Uroplakin-3b-like protein 1 n=1 Tax=Geospiza fortis TaxID=48883 RepID=A0A8N5I134_GEOFO|nr:uroplakin-3b-like protein 1 [Geospiza fortis]